MRSKYLALLLVPFAGLLLAGKPTPDHTAGGATITRLVLRDYEISIAQGENGAARYDVYANSGQALDTNLDTTQLQAKYPNVYDRLQPAVAGGEADSTMMMLDLNYLDY